MAGSKHFFLNLNLIFTACSSKVTKLAKALAFGMEDIDKGKDMRSFKTRSTNFSLRSGSSARRRHIMYSTASLRSHRHHEVETDMDASVGSDDSGSWTMWTGGVRYCWVSLLMMEFGGSK
jgi:hypothetical protein